MTVEVSEMTKLDPREYSSTDKVITQENKTATTREILRESRPVSEGVSRNPIEDGALNHL